MIVVSLFLLACGTALILNTVVAGRSSNRSPFRPENVDESGRGLKRMLPMIAMAVAGYMAQRGGADASPQAQGGGLGGMLGSLLGGGTGRQSGAGGLASMLDMDGDGNPLDDILRMMGR